VSRLAASTSPGRVLVQRLGWVGLAVLVAVVLVVFGPGDGHSDGNTADAAARAAALKETTLCPVCDGQNVLESNAPVATAIRNQIDERVGQGLSDDEIRAFLADRYGDDVVALPPASGVASLVWVAPVVVVGLAAAGVALALWRWRVEGTASPGEDDRRLVEAARRGRGVSA
jgi:cytochrome c-type biogenesis protein CcmH/NrfF